MQSERFWRRCCCSFLCILSVVPFDTPRRINQFLLAGIIGVAIRANFKVNIADGGTGLERVPANTGNDCTLVFGVNSFFHYILRYIKI